ncbi:MAG: flagellar basal body L-ring protein FlgH [Phycisphaeraceae bacterium]|nr:MAG: flagellar basal body L-ring protein FlgH [Phycisphaeraceae bacterium]
MNHTTIRTHALAAALTLALLAAPALGQSLLRPRDPAPAPAAAPGGEQVRVVSMMFIDKPKPRDFALYDQVTIVIEENSRTQSSQTLETKKDSKLDAALKKFPSLKDLIEGELRTGDSSPIAEVGFDDKQKFKGEGKFSRSDRFSAKITARVIDVKPNGTLVLEARKTIITNKEAQTLVLAGVCRKEDVTNANTVLSSQLADLTVVQQNAGDVNDGAEKGWITRFFDSVFGF